MQKILVHTNTKCYYFFVFTYELTQIFLHFYFVQNETLYYYYNIVFAFEPNGGFRLLIFMRGAQLDTHSKNPEYTLVNPPNK